MLIKYVILLLVALATRCCGILVLKNFFRYDYEWIEQAQGWMKYHVVPATWEEAMLRCRAEGSVLASPITEPVKAAMVAFVQKRNGNYKQLNIFTGVHATFSRGDYASIEGVPLLKLAVTWASGEPDNYENSERCLMMSLYGNMSDTRCDKVLPYICYNKKPEKTLITTECGTTDLEYYLDRTTRSCYKFHPNGLLWSQAYMTCMAEGGYLAIINDEKEVTAVTSIFKISGLENFCRIKEHFYGEPMENLYNKWQGGRPNSPWRVGKETPENKREYAVAIARQGMFFDFSTNEPFAFLCEMEPNSLG